MKNNFAKQSNKKGFALLIAVLVSSLFLAIGAVIYEITYIQIILSGVGKDSQFAFYAADTGAECALYWEQKYAASGDDGSGSAFNIYDTSGNGIIDDTNRNKVIAGSLSPIVCSGQNISPNSAINNAALEQAVQTNFRQGDFTYSGTFIGVPAQTFFKFPLDPANPSNGACVEVVVSKYKTYNTNSNTYDYDDPGTQPVATTIISRGYNTCNVNNPNRVERAIQITLQ